MITEGIVLSYKISYKGNEVDKAKVEVIEKLPPPVNIKGIKSFLGHAGFYVSLLRTSSRFQSLCATFSIRILLLNLMIIV